MNSINLEDLSTQDLMNAFGQVKVRFDLKWRQRDALAGSTHYGAIMVAAHLGDWSHVKELLLGAGIVTP